MFAAVSEFLIFIAWEPFWETYIFVCVSGIPQYQHFDTTSIIPRSHSPSSCPLPAVTEISVQTDRHTRATTRFPAGDQYQRCIIKKLPHVNSKIHKDERFFPRSHNKSTNPTHNPWHQQINLSPSTNNVCSIMCPNLGHHSCPAVSSLCVWESGRYHCSSQI